MFRKFRQKSWNHLSWWAFEFLHCCHLIWFDPFCLDTIGLAIVNNLIMLHLIMQNSLYYRFLCSLFLWSYNLLACYDGLNTTRDHDFQQVSTNLFLNVRAILIVFWQKWNCETIKIPFIASDPTISFANFHYDKWLLFSLLCSINRKDYQLYHSSVNIVISRWFCF